MVLAAAGAVDHDSLVKSAEQVFGKVPDETPETSVAALVTKVRGWGGDKTKKGLKHWWGGGCHKRTG
jgi:hypothetical protein